MDRNDGCISGPLRSMRIPSRLTLLWLDIARQNILVESSFALRRTNSRQYQKYLIAKYRGGTIEQLQEMSLDTVIESSCGVSNLHETREEVMYIYVYVQFFLPFNSDIALIIFHNVEVTIW